MFTTIENGPMRTRMQEWRTPEEAQAIVWDRNTGARTQKDNSSVPKVGSQVRSPDFDPLVS